MRKTIKKGFTLVELLVTIAIIAILSIVAIVGYVSFTTKARISNDTTIVTELNRVLQAEHVTKKPDTMQEIVDEVYKNGFVLSRLTPTASKHHIVYDSVKDRFFLLNDKYKVVGGDLDGKDLTGDAWDHWKVIHSYSETNDEHFSYYLGEMTGNEPAEGLLVHNGIDVGENTINKIKYENKTTTEKKVIVRTKGSALTVDAQNDTVKHYGEGTVLNIEAVDTQNCYREFGTFENAQIKTGRIVIEKEDAKIENLLLIAKTDKSGFEDIIVETKTGASLPVLDRTEVNIAEKGTLVLNVVTPTSDEFIYLTKAGVIEQVVVTTEVVDTSAVDVTTVESAKAASETSTQTYNASEQIANVGTKNANGDYVDANNEVIIYSDGTVAEGKDPANIAVEAKADEEAVSNGTTYFAGGVGTENSPFIISTLEEWNNLADNSELATEGDYFIVVSDITFNSDFKYIPNFAGDIDFQNHTITCQSDMSDEVFILYTVGDTLIHNLNVNNLKSDFSLVYANKGDIKFKSINMYGSHTVSGHNSGMFIMYVGLYSTASEINIELSNCDVYSSITGVGSNYVGAYLGTFNYLINNQTAKLVMKDCTNYGTMVGEKVAMVVSSSASCGWCDFSDGWTTLPVVKMYFDNVNNRGILHGNSYAGLVMSRAGLEGTYEYVEGGKTRGTIEFYSDEQFTNRIEEDGERVKLDKDLTPSVLDVVNSGSGATIVGAFAKVDITQDKSIDFTNVKASNATKYVVSYAWTGAYGASNGGAFSYNIEIPANQIDDAVIYDYEWVNYDTYGDSKAIPSTESEISDITYFGTTLKIDAQNHYVFYKLNSVVRTQPTLRVYAFDSDNNVIKIGEKDGTAYQTDASLISLPSSTAYNFIQNGYTLNARCGSDGGDRLNDSVATGRTCTNQISVKRGDVIFVKGRYVCDTGTAFSCLGYGGTGKVAFLANNGYAERITNLGSREEYQYFTISDASASYVKLCLDGLVSSNDDVVINIYRDGAWLSSN